MARRSHVTEESAQKELVSRIFLGEFTFSLKFMLSYRSPDNSAIKKGNHPSLSSGRIASKTIFLAVVAKAAA